MKIDLEPKKVYKLLPTDILFQTAFWSQVKSQLGWKPHAFDFSSLGLTGDVLVLTRTIGRGISAAYVPQGPEYGPNPEAHGLFLEGLSDAMIKHLDPTVVFIRYDLPWESPYAADLADSPEVKGWTGHPEPRLRELRMNFGTKKWRLRKTALDMTVADTLVVSLTGTEEEILARMKPKTRYNIRLSERKGVRVFPGSLEMLPVFYELYSQMAGRNGLQICEYKYFSALFSALASKIDSSEIHFLLAAHDKDILAGSIIALSRQTATYLFGASSNNKRNLMGSYAIQWAGIRLAREKGCITYDMGAVSPTKDPCHPFFGLYRFKTGFGGNIIHRNGSWDYPLDTERYEKFRRFEIMSNTCGLTG